MNAAAAMTTLRFTPFNVGAILICLTCLVYTGLRHHTDKLQNKLFLVIVIDVAIAATSDVIAELVRAYTEGAAAATTVEIVGYIYFVTHVALAPLFFLYVIIVCRDAKSGNFLRNNLIGLPFYLAELIALTNPLTHWMYSYGPDMVLTRQWAMYFAYVVGMLYLVLGFAQLIRRWRALTVVKRRALGYFFLMATAGVIIQLVFPAICIELFAESIAVLGVMMFIENEDGFIDFESGLYNRHALETDLNMYAKTSQSYNIIALRVTNIDSYLHIGSSTVMAQAVTTALADYFKVIMPWYYVYRADPARYVLLNPQLDDEAARKIAEKISGRFQHSWELGDVSIDLRAIVALVHVPKDLPTVNDVLYFIDTPVPPPSDSDVLTGDDLEFLVRQAEVERAVQRGFDENGYEVYYQPIFDENGTPHSAEALMRLHDRVLGNVPPFEFISVAERMGLIDDIGEFALCEVCSFLMSGVPQELGIAHISVNLSVIQCMQADFSVHADKVVQSYGVDSNLVSFEITESVAAGDYEFLGRMMSQLKKGGHRFAMDDYGTGYSNMHSLVALDFDIVKIDRSVLWDAEKSDLGRVILQNGVSLVRDIGCEVLVEGVETEQQVELLHTLNVDYYQGFYYAKPMSKDDFISFLETYSSNKPGMANAQ